MPASRHRPPSRRRLLHLQRLAVLRGKRAPQQPKYSARFWALASALSLMLLVVAIFAVRNYTIKQIDLDGTLRAQLIPALEKELGHKIEVGKIESDYISQVVLHDVVIGRDKESPLGALAQARTITIYVNAVNLLLNRDDPLQAVSGIALQTPQLFIERDAQGRLNLADLFKDKARDGAKWRGWVQIDDGRFYFRDYQWRSASGQNILLDGRNLKGRVRFNGEAPVRYALEAPLIYAGKDKVALRNISMSGTAAADGKWFAVEAALPSAPVTLLADWAFRKREVIARSGRVGGRLRMMWDTTLPESQRITTSGLLHLDRVHVLATSLKEPGTNQPVALQNATGVLKFMGGAFESGDIRLTALGTPLKLAGKVAIAPLSFDVRVASTAFNTSRLLSAARSLNRDPQLAKTQVRASNANGEVRVTGDMRAWTARGKLALANLAVAHPQQGQGSLRSPVAQIAIESRNGRSQANVELRAAQGEFSSPAWGNWQASGQVRGKAIYSTATRQPQLQLALGADTVSGRSQRLGAWRAGGADALVRWNGTRVAARLRATKLAGRQQQAGTLGARNLNAQVDFAPQAGNRLAAHFTASSALGSGARMPSLQGLNWQTGAVTGFVNWQGAQGDGWIETAAFRARQPRLGALQAQNLRARANFNTQRTATNFNTQFNARGARVQNAQAGTWNAAEVQGIAVGRNTRSALQLQTDVEARRFSGAQSRYGRWSGNAVRVAAATADLSGGVWNGIAALGQVDVSRVNRAAISPSLANYVRQAGTVTAKARFTNLGSRDPMVKGWARLSDLVLRQQENTIALREIETQIAYGGQQLRLAGINAQSPFGPLTANAQSNVATGRTRLSLVAPRVEVAGSTLNPYLASAGVRLDGVTVGRLSVETTDAATPTYRTQFEFNLPRAQLVATKTGNAQNPIRVADASLRGSGEFRFRSESDWQFSGDAAVFARHLAAERLADLQGEVRAADLRLTAHGVVARQGARFVPQVQGEMRAGSVLAPLADGEKAALQSARAQFEMQPDALRVTRFEAGAGGESKLYGHAALRQVARDNLTVSGQLLLEKFDAARAQDLMEMLQGSANDNVLRPQLSGVLFTRADFNGHYTRGRLTFDKIGLQSRLYRGRVAYADTLLPLDAVQLETTLQLPLNREFSLDRFVLWSRGARLSLNGTVTPQNDTVALALEANVNTLRVQDLYNVSALRPAMQQISQSGDVDGMLSGHFKIGGTLEQPRVEGRTALKLAQAFGLEIENVGANLLLETNRPDDSPAAVPEFRLAVSDFKGVVEGTPVQGTLTADSAQNIWKLDLETDGEFATNRLLRAMQSRDDQRLAAWRDVPLRGELGAKFHLTGTLKADDGSNRFAMSEGTLNIESGTLRWRGSDLGRLTADLQLQNGVFHARRLELVREGEEEGDQSHLRIAGVLPVSLDTPDLDARVEIDNGRLSFVLEVMQELRRSLAERGQNVAYLDAVLKRLEDLPSNVDGRFDLQAQLEQSWRVPVVDVRSLQARDVYFVADSGERRRLPDVTGRFIYDGNDNGAITVRSAELRLPNLAEDTDSSDDLLIRTLRPGRIVPNGEMALTVEILNADLQQLAQWLPDLRNADGESAIRGRLSDFVLQLAGTVSAPTVTGSLQGENWEYRNYGVDLVRLNRFTIADGRLQVAPGALTVVKGDFQSEAAWGYLPWTWGDEDGTTGISKTRPMEIHFPLEKENLGALAGIFVSQIVNVDAEEFAGEVTARGTIAQPQLEGQARIHNGTFRLRSALAELDAGVQNLSGTLSFTGGNRLEFGGEGLSGKLVPADSVQAPTTGNEGTAARQERDLKRPSKNPPPRVAGDFNLRGGVTLDLEPRNWSDPRLAFAAHRYDLRLVLNNGNYATETISGVRELQLLAAWKTEGTNARQGQNIQWALTAKDNAKSGKNSEGQMLSFVSLQLTPDFATSMDAFLRARAQTFTSAQEFAAWPEIEKNTAFRQALADAAGLPSRLEWKSFFADWKQVANGTIDGVLTLDNDPAAQPQTEPFTNPRTLPRGARVIPTGGASTGRVQLAQERRRPNNRRGQDNQESLANRPPLRLRGTIRLEQAELYGPPPTAPVQEVSNNGDGTGETARGVLSRLPDSPAFDINLVVGNSVQLVSSNLRATITGDIALGGTPHSPVISGKLFTRSGNITFPNARARLESGEITISARRDPVTDMLRMRVDIDVVARGRTGRYDITLRVRGPLDTGEGSTQDLRVDISSNPPLSSDEAFARLLGTAALNSNELRGQDETYARALVGFLSGPLFSGLERSLERSLGLDSIALDYRIDEPIGIEIGKAIGDRLYISYRRALSRGAGERTPFDLRIDYRIKGDLQIGLETDENRTNRITLRRSWRF